MTYSDDELLAQSSGLNTIFCDGFGAYRKHNGVFRTVGWVSGSGAQVSLVVSIDGAKQAAVDVARLLAEAPFSKAFEVMKFGARRH